MALPTIPKSQEICQRLLRGYQFSPSDSDDPNTEELYHILVRHLPQFQSALEFAGFSLIETDQIIFLEKDDKILTNEEKQAVVVLFLLVDLWMEGGGAFSDLFQLRIPWAEQDWFRDGYGREYLAQVGISEVEAIEELLKRLERKGLVHYYVDTRSLILRKPAERLINLARKIDRQLKSSAEERGNE